MFLINCCEMTEERFYYFLDDCEENTQEEVIETEEEVQEVAEEPPESPQKMDIATPEPPPPVPPVQSLATLETVMQNFTLEEEESQEDTEGDFKSTDVSQDEEMEGDEHQYAVEEAEHQQQLPEILDESQIIRRSRRIKKISVKNKRSVGHGLVKDREIMEKFNPEKPTELEVLAEKAPTVEKTEEEKVYERETEERLKKFVNIKDNEYKCDRNISKEAKKMLCDCFLTEDEYNRGELGCGEDCLNRLLMIECGPKCNVAARCTNKRFQTAAYAPCKVFRTEMKGFGIQAVAPIQPGEFIMEYVGEVLDCVQFEVRAAEYSEKENKHYYFMALRGDAVIDATTRGNISRFINHSCDPNAETQKWTVNGELRIGFFSTKFVSPGEEITFDYQFQRYG